MIGSFVIIQNNTTIKPRKVEALIEFCFVIIQNNTTIKPRKVEALIEFCFVIIQNNTTIKPQIRFYNVKSQHYFLLL